MKTVISIPDEIFEAAEQTAKGLSMSRSELYTWAIKNHVRDHEAGGVTETLNEVYAAESSRLDPLLAQMQAASMVDWEW